MTKKIRVENADTSDHKVDIEVWEKRTEQPDALIKTVALDHPTSLSEEFVHSTRYLVIKERKTE